MKKILVPTDFSPIAENALDYAIEIASLFSSEILLYHVYTFHRRADYDHNYPIDKQPYVQNIKNKMRDAKAKVADKAAAKGVKIEAVVEKNHVFYLFENKVLKYDIDLIVMGTKGATGLETVIFGSVAVTALESAKRPVLVIPPEYRYRKIDQALLAADLNEVSDSILTPLKELLVKFHSGLTVLSVVDKLGHGGGAKRELEFQGVDTQYEEIELTKSVNKSINAYVKTKDLDLVCMIRREKGFFESIFRKSVTKTQVYRTKVPFLVLSEN
jgi:nucleotide-binding universal stress UspA family protein